jgi:PAS domain S-box-containing protein
MIVEDERIVAEDIKLRLESLGYGVTGIAVSGISALRKAKKIKPDLILMDIKLKDESDGIETAVKFRQDFDIPVVYLTSYSDKGTLEKTKKSEPFGYILKPFKDNELKAAIETAIYKHMMEKQLKESKVWLSTILKSISDGVISTDIEGKITFMNTVAENLTGWKEQESTGKPLQNIFQIIKEDDNEEISNITDTILKKEHPFSLTDQVVLVTKVGNHIPIENTGTSIKNEQGGILGIVLVFKDITQRKEAEKQLKILSDVFEQSVNTAAVLDLKGNIVYVNNKFLELNQFSSDEVIGKNWRDFLSLFSTLREEYTQIKDKVLLKGLIWKGEVRDKAKSGDVIWRESTIFPIKNNKGDIIYTVYMSNDITERKRFEESLQESEMRFRSLIEQTTDSVWCYEYAPPIPVNIPVQEQVEQLYHGILVECNDVCAKSYGASQTGEVLGKKLTELFGTNPGSLDELFTGFIQNGYRTIDGEGVEVLDDGTKRYFLNNGHGVIQNGMLIRVWGTFRDITDRKNVEIALQESESRFRSTFEQAAVGIAHITPDGKFLRINNKFCDILGYTYKEMLDLTFQNITYPDDLEVDLEYTKQVLAKKIQTYSVEKRYIRKNGSIVWINLTVSLLCKSTGEPDYFIGVIEDISERKQTEEMFRNAFDYAAIGRVIANLEGKFVRVNHSLCMILGYSEEEMLQRSWQEITHPDHLKEASENVINLLQGKIFNFTSEQKFIHKKGHIICIRLNIVLTRDINNKPNYMIGDIEDITNRKEAEETLKKSEERLALAVEATGAGIYDYEIPISPETYLSERWANIFGYKKDELPEWNNLHEWLNEKSYPEDLPYTQKVYSDFIEGRTQDYDVEIRMKNKNDDWIFVKSLLKAANRDKDGRAIRVVGVMLDITEEKHINMALRKEKEKAQQYLDIAGVIIVVIDRNENIVLLNKKGYELLGYKSEEIIGKNWFDNFIPYKDREQVKSVFFKLMAGEIKLMEYYENAIITKYKEERIIAWHNSIIKNDNGEIIGTISSGEDITEHKYAEARLQESEARYRILVEQSLVGVHLISEESFIYQNETGARMFGYHPDEIVGKIKPLDLVFPEDRDRVFEYVQEQLSNEKEIVNYSFRGIRKDGTTIDCEFFGQQIVFQGQSAILGTCLDITERKKLQKTIEIAQRASRLSSLATLAAGISHEINQPLTALKVKVDGLLYWGEKKPKFYRENLINNLQFISDEADKIDQIIKHVRSLTRQDKINLTSINLNTVIQNSLSLIQQELNLHNIYLKLKLEKKLPEVIAQTIPVEQIIVNLVTNAIHALDRIETVEKRITISTKSEKNMCLLEVMDNGPGIPEKNIDKLFDPFFTTETCEENMGLGLAIVQNLVEGFGGTIQAANNNKGGAVFIVSLPVASI